MRRGSRFNINSGSTVFGLRETVSMLLFGFGGLLVFLAVICVFSPPNTGVPPEIERGVKAAFSIGGIVGLGIIAWGIAVRSADRAQGRRLLWITYIALIVPFIGLAAFVGKDIVRLIGESPVREGSRMAIGLIMFAIFLSGPVVLLFKKKPLMPPVDQDTDADGV